MDRRDEVLTFIRPEMERQFELREKTIIAWSEENSEQFIAECLAPIVALFARCVELQKKGGKGEVHYLCISSLLSSISTGSYQLRLDLYDGRFLIDEDAITEYFVVPYVFSSFSNDLAVLKSNIKKRFIRLTSLEMEHISFIYAKYHFRLIADLFRDLGDYIDVLGKQMQRAEDYKVLFGELWGESKKIFPAED